MIKIQDNDKGNKINFVSDIPIYLINAIRRSVLEIPVLAIDEVEIFKNDSALYDEIISHRLGLVPIKTDKLKEQKFKLQVKGPKMVSSGDLSPSIDTGYEIPIVLLEKEQELEIVADAKLGKGIEHVKYSPGLLYYKHNISENLLDFVHVDKNGKVSFDEDELKDKKVSEEVIGDIKKLKDVNELIITIESWGQLDVKDIFNSSIDALDSNLKELNKLVK